MQQCRFRVNVRITHDQGPKGLKRKGADLEAAQRSGEIAQLQRLQACIVCDVQTCIVRHPTLGVELFLHHSRPCIDQTIQCVVTVAVIANGRSHTAKAASVSGPLQGLQEHKHNVW